LKYNYYLDGVLIADEPEGWQQLVSKINRQTDIKGIFLTQDVKLVFGGDGYDILKPKFDANFCDTTTILIEEERQEEKITIFDGIIFVSACQDFPNLCEMECSLEDNSFFAKIFNNKSIEAHCQAGMSKNLVTYTPAITDLLYVFDVCAGTYDPGGRACVTPYEAFKSLVSFMTDDTCDFDSVYLGVGGEWNSNTKRLMITSGIKIGSTNPAVYGAGEPLLPKFSFLKLFQEIDKNLNIGMMIDTSGARPKVIIENNDFFYDDESLILLNIVNGLKVYVDQDKLYSSVRFGSSKTLEGSTCPDPVFPEEQSFLSFKDEQFYILGKCNIDKELNLVREWIVSSNVIQSIVPPLTETSYDGDIVLIVCEKPGFSNLAKQGNPFNFTTPTPRYYNEDLLNSNVALRYLGGVPNSIAAQLSDVTDECWVGRIGLNYPGAGSTLQCPTAVIKIHNPNEYNDKTTPPFFDTNNRFTLNPTNTYTCGAASGGLYAVEITQIIKVARYDADIPFNVLPTQYHRLKVQAIIQRFTSAAVLIGSYDCYPPRYINGYQPFNDYPLIGNHPITQWSPPFVLDPTDYVRVSFNFTTENIGIGTTGYFYINMLDGGFKTTFTSKGGGDLQTYDPLKYPVYKLDFTYPITADEFDLIKANPQKAITINTDGKTNIRCYVDKAEYNHKSGICNFTLIRAVST
jgi:hypothetical protein